MNFFIETYIESSAPSTSSEISETVKINLNIKDLVFVNEKINGQINQKISGTFDVIGKDFETLFKYQLLPSTGGTNVYYGITVINYKIYLDGVKIADTNKNVTLIEIDKICKRAKLEFKNIDFGEYGNVYKIWESKTNILDFMVLDKKIIYKQNRVYSTTTVTETKQFDAIKVGSGDRITTGQYDYIQTKNPNGNLVKVEFAYNDHSCTNNTVTLDITYTYGILTAKGMYSGGIQNYTHYPPSGLNWSHPDAVTSYSTKNIKTYEHTTGALIEASDCGLDRDMFFYENFIFEHEDISDIEYNTGILLKDFINNTTGLEFDSNSFKYMPEMGSIMLLGLSNSIPTILGGLPSPQSILKISVKQVLDYLVSRGFSWYIETISNVNYFRLIYTKNLYLLNLSSGTAINFSNIFGKKWDVNSKWKVIETPFWKISNETDATSGAFFGNYEYDNNPPNNSLSIQDGGVYAEIDYIVDAKENNFDRSNVEGVVILATDYDSVTDKYTIKTDANFEANNIEFSILTLIYQRLCNVPNTYQSQPDINRIFKDKEIELKIPINNIFDVNLYQFVDYHGFTCEIIKIVKDKGNNFANVTLRGIWAD